MNNDRPPVTGTSHPLPFERLSPTRFEDLCLWLLRREGYELRHRGLAGGDGGIDLIADRDNERLAVQCKREQNFGPKKASDAVTGLLSVPLEPPITHLLLAVSSSVSAQAGDAAREAAGDLPLQIWAVSELNEQTKRHPEVVREFFQLDTPPSPTPFDPPPPTDHFAGRTQLIDELVEMLVSGSNVGLTALQGMGGIGKTALAKKLAQRLRQKHADAFPGGVLWADVGPDPDVINIFDLWAQIAGIDHSHLQDAGARATALRHVLTRRGRLCLVLDDVWDAQVGRQLQGVAPDQCPCIITTRQGDVAKQLRCTVQQIDVLEPEEALALLRQHLGELEAFEETAREIAKLIGYLPLALEIVAGLVDDVQELPGIAELLQQDSRIQLLQLRSGQEEAQLAKEDSVEACLQLSYDRLSPEDQRRFRALGILAEAPFDTSMLAAIWGHPSKSQAPSSEPIPTIVRRFRRRQLLQVSTADNAVALQEPTFRQHALLYSYAHRLLGTEGERDEVQERFVDHCQSFVESADWQQVDVLYVQVQHAWALIENDEKRTPYFALAAVDYQTTRGKWQERLRWLEAAHAAVQGSSDRKLQGRLLHELGSVCDDLGQKHEALQHYTGALQIRREVGDRAGEASALNNIAQIDSDCEHIEQALKRFNKALEIRRVVQDRTGEAVTINNIAKINLDLGRKQEALKRFNEALQIHREVGSRAGEGTALNNFAMTYYKLGLREEALLNSKEALSIFREIGDRWLQAVTLFNIAHVLRSLDRLPEAVETLESCIALETELGHPDFEADSVILERFRRELDTQSS